MYTYFDARTHDCGCQTRFNCLDWRSETTVQCDEHHAMEPITPVRPARTYPSGGES